MPLQEKENKKINEEAAKKVEGSPNVPHAASSSSQPTTRSQNSNKVGFRIDFAIEAADKCLQDEGINADAYIDLFKELMRAFEAFGSVFNFVRLEVYEKVETLQNFSIGEGKVCYRTVERMLQHYRDNPEDKDRSNPARNLLRLHRSLDFVSKALATFFKAEKEDGMGQKLRELYMATAAHYQDEQTQRIVSAVLVLMPPPDDIIKRMVGTDSATQDHLLAAIPTLCNRLDHLVEATQKLYVKYEMQNLR